MSNPIGRPTGRARQRLNLLEVMVLIAGLGVGLWVILGDIRKEGAEPDKVLLTIIAALGGVSLVGPVLLLAERGRHRPWGAGKLLWFGQGMASWLLWPPIVY